MELQCKSCHTYTAINIPSLIVNILIINHTSKFDFFECIVYIIEGTMEPKLSKPAVLDWLKQLKVGVESSTHNIEFEIDSNFGFPGAIIVTNKYDKEIYLEGFSIEGVLDISCNSWVQPEIVQQKRIFFSNKVTNTYVLNITCNSCILFLV